MKFNIEGITCDDVHAIVQFIVDKKIMWSNMGTTFEEWDLKKEV